MLGDKQIYTVFEVNRYIKAILSQDDNLHYIYVKGEISNFKPGANGHLYFSLKDQDSLINVAMFNSYASKLVFLPKNGDEVIVQANTYIATVLGITSNNAKPVFVEPNVFFNIDTSKLESNITKNTKAILVTHLYGQASNMDAILKLCRKYSLFLVEDCAQAHYAQYKNRYVGTFGDLGFFSFYPTKNIGGFGDGGAVVTNNEKLYKKVMMLRNYGSDRRYDFEIANGSNSRLDEIQASLLSVKLKHHLEITREKIRIAETYLSRINNPLVQVPKLDENCTSVWHLFVLVVDDQKHFISHMANKGVCTDVHYPIPPHLSKCYKNLGYKAGDYPITEYYCSHIVDLPIFNGMTDDEINSVINAVNSYEK